MSLLDRIRSAMSAFRSPLTSVTVRVDDSSGWQSFTGGRHDRDASEIAQQYSDALEAWRKNPFAKRITDIVTDYCLGDGMTPTAPGTMGAFIDRWWNHPKNRMDLRMPDLTDELTRAGDLFITLHRNPQDGMSYVRPIPKDAISRIETAANDWETELAYYEQQPTGETRRWLAAGHPEAADADAVMCHYAVNRVVGALMGESDFATLIPWLLRYSRMVEDRVRMHWAARAFLWIVEVPTAKVREKQEQYRNPPEAGTVIIKDASEEWKAVTPDLKGMDAQYDLRAVRQLIDAGSGMPPHWRGEAHDVSLATAEAMEHAASRHLRRRQLYLRYLVTDLAHTAYDRAWQLRTVKRAPNRELIAVNMTDIDRTDNRDLAKAAWDLSQGMAALQAQLPGTSNKLQRLIARTIMRFAGEPLPEPDVEAIFQEIAANPKPVAPDVGAGTGGFETRPHTPTEEPNHATE
jgi:hypothetical protein